MRFSSLPHSLSLATARIAVVAAVLIAQTIGSIAVSAQAYSPIYMCTDKDGHRIATNIPSEKKQGYKCVRQFDTLMPTAPAAKPAGKGVATASPADFPKVGADTQKSRDDVRHKVLGEELASEQKLLDKAVSDLNDARTLRPAEEKSSAKYLERVSDAEKAVQRHRANVESLQREIGKLK